MVRVKQDAIDDLQLQEERAQLQEEWVVKEAELNEREAPARAKVYGAVKGTISNLPKLLSIRANTYSCSATNA
jgi:hypothetical protein